MLPEGVEGELAEQRQRPAADGTADEIAPAPAQHGAGQGADAAHGKRAARAGLAQHAVDRPAQTAAAERVPDPLLRDTADARLEQRAEQALGVDHGSVPVCWPCTWMYGAAGDRQALVGHRLLC